MMKRETIKGTSSEELLATLGELTKRAASATKALVDVWIDAGQILAELRERHIRGDFGKASWASYCRRIGLSRKMADIYIGAYEAPDRKAYLEQMLDPERGERAREPKAPITIIVKRPGVVFGYITELNEPAKLELFALLWRNYPKLLRKVGDQVGAEGDERPGARPS